MPIDITLQVKMSVEESSLEDALEEYDELTVADMVKQVLDKGIALEDLNVAVTEGPKNLEEWDKVKNL